MILFSKVSWKGCISFWLVSSWEMSISKAIAASYLAASGDKLKDVATIIREVVLKAYKSSKEMPYPLPQMILRGCRLKNFHRNWRIYRKWAKHWKMRTDKTFYLLHRSRCLSRGISRAMEIQEEHCYMCQLEHLYRSKQLTTILSRRCHCKSYSFGLELKTVMAKAIDEADTYLTPQTVTGNNLVFHSE